MTAGSRDFVLLPEHVTASHIIRRVLLRQGAILNYINPF